MKKINWKWVAIFVVQAVVLLPLTVGGLLSWLIIWAISKLNVQWAKNANAWMDRETLEAGVMWVELFHRQE